MYIYCTQQYTTYISRGGGWTAVCLAQCRQVNEPENLFLPCYNLCMQNVKRPKQNICRGRLCIQQLQGVLTKVNSSKNELPMELFRKRDFEPGASLTAAWYGSNGLHPIPSILNVYSVLRFATNIFRICTILRICEYICTIR